MSDVIDKVEAESKSLELHVDLCSLRYQQLLHKFDVVDDKFAKIESMLVEIKNTIRGDEKESTSLYLKWAGAIIGVLSSIVIGLVLHLLFK